MVALTTGERYTVPMTATDYVVSGNKYEREGISLCAVSRNLQGPDFVRVSTSDGRELEFPLEDLQRMLYIRMNVQNDARRVDDLRFRASHPALDPALASLLLGGGADVDASGETLYRKHLYATDVSMVGHSPREGSIEMQWCSQGLESRWLLKIHGAGSGDRDLTLGEARWDDREGIARLVHALQQRDSVLAMAGMTHPEEVSLLSARVAINEFGASGGMPLMSPLAVRKVLNGAGLLGVDDGWDGMSTVGHIRLMQAPAEWRRVPVAVVIICPNAPQCEPARDDDGDFAQGALARRKRWLQRAENALVQEGWYVVDLPAPNTPHPSERGYLWVTRIAPAEWGRMRAAIAPHASKLLTTRGSRFV